MSRSKKKTIVKIVWHTKEVNSKNGRGRQRAIDTRRSGGKITLQIVSVLCYVVLYCQAFVSWIIFHIEPPRRWLCMLSQNFTSPDSNTRILPVRDVHDGSIQFNWYSLFFSLVRFSCCLFRPSMMAAVVKKLIASFEFSNWTAFFPFSLSHFVSMLASFSVYFFFTHFVGWWCVSSLCHIAHTVHMHRFILLCLRYNFSVYEPCTQFKTPNSSTTSCSMFMHSYLFQSFTHVASFNALSMLHWNCIMCWQQNWINPVRLFHSTRIERKIIKLSRSANNN